MSILAIDMGLSFNFRSRRAMGAAYPPMLTLPPTSLRPGDRACIAVSGGADSTALLLLAHAANTEPRHSLGIGLSAIHVNHSLRGAESEADQSFVTSLCSRLGIPLHLRTVDVRGHAAAHRQTIEEAARNLRYAVFTELLAASAASHILTAHTLDDQAETVLMKLLRGAWLEGLSAIAPELPLHGGKVIRPLLRTPRADLLAFLEARGETWREDSSNSDDTFSRNRIRHTILPVLRQENPSLDRTLANLATLAQEEQVHWQPELDRLLPQLLLPGTAVRGGGRASSTAPGERTIAIELERLRALSAALRRRVLRAAAQQLGTRLTFDDTTRLLTLAGLAPPPLDPTVPGKPGGKLQLQNSLAAERTLRELRLSVKS